MIHSKDQPTRKEAGASPWDFCAQVVLVTGGSSGIGRACVEAFAAAGAQVFSADLRHRDEPATATAPFESLHCDVTSEVSVAAAVAHLTQAAGRIDVLVHCAGVLEQIRRTVDQELADWERVMSVNLKGTYLCAREVGRVMAGQRKGVLITIGSAAAMVGLPSSNAYAPGKAAVSTMTRNLATEWARFNVRVNCIAPGYIATPMSQELFEAGAGGMDAALRQVPLRRLGEPGDIAAVALFLASSQARYITGVTLPVDGGWSASGGSGSR